MILLNSFYNINSFQTTDKEIIAGITINKDHSIFEGHFPNNPITPGVVQLEIVKELLGEKYQRKMNLVSLSNCKFLAILNPLETRIVEVQLTFNEEDGVIKISGTIRSEGTQFLKVAAVYQ